MKVEIQELDPCKRQLVVEAPEDEVRAAWTAACGRVQRDARLPGFPLAPEGREEARGLARALAGVPIRAVYASPLERAVETAGINASATACRTSSPKRDRTRVIGTLPRRKPGSRASRWTRPHAAVHAARTSSSGASTTNWRLHGSSS